MFVPNFTFFTTIMSLNFGLNIKSKSLKPKLILDDEAEEIVVPKSTPVASEKVEISQTEDEPLNEYDIHFDANQEIKQRLKRERDGDFGQGKQARYMQVLIENSKQRRLERQIIKDKRWKQENEELYGEVETFVTESYKLKLKEEEEVKIKQDQEERSRNIGGFYKGLLNQVEKQRGPIILGDQEMAKKYLKNGGNAASETSERFKIDREPNNVKLNDDGQVVDSIKQLKGGINFVRPAADSVATKDSSNLARKEMAVPNKVSREIHLKRKADIVKQKELVETHQLEGKILAERKLVERIQSKIGVDKQAEARERYLARKRAGSGN